MRKDLRWAWTLAAILGALARAEEPTKPTAPASEANPAVPAAGHSVHGEAFNDGPRRKAYLMPGQGKVDFPVTAAGPEVQGFVNQGVAQLHSFAYLEAERSFRQAALLDPGCAMAYWGMAMANVNNARRAEGFLKEARKRAATAAISPRERLYLDALAASYKPGADAKARRQGFLLGLEAIVQGFPADLEARAWLAMVTWQGAGSDGIGSRQAVDALIESVLHVEPLHPGAHHYRIHLWDGVTPERAETAAALFARAAPGIAHAWHMPGHTYTGLKRYADAAYQQEGSARVDHAYMLRDRVMPFEIHNYAHNNQWLATSLSHVGRARDAVAVARNLVEQPRDPQKNGRNDGGSSQRSGRMRWAEVLVRYELWDDLVAATTSGALDWSDLPVERKERAYTLGLAYAAQGDKPELAEQIALLKALGPADKADAPKDAAARKDRPKRAPKRSAVPGHQAALAELEGYRELLDGRTEAAFGHFARATGMRPEALARAHAAARHDELALSTAKSAVDRNPGQVPPLACYVEILQALGKTHEAQEAYRTLEPLARAADRDVPVFRRLASIVSQWQADGGWSPPGPAPETGEAAAARIDLSTLGPLVWGPSAAEPFSKADTDGLPWTLTDHRGRNVLVLFYLGGRCAHCMQQLQAFGKEVDAFRALNTELVAVGTDDPDATRSLKANAEGIAFPMPLLADPRLEVFRAYRCYDDFEGQPLHGTFLIDARGAVRYRRIAADPFLDVEFLKAEATRINRLQP
jgi:peroxiredoxin/tetratricopeptide (TPR) repeat protein